jgi:hypothetical protein
MLTKRRRKSGKDPKPKSGKAKKRRRVVFAPKSGKIRKGAK